MDILSKIKPPSFDALLILDFILFLFCVIGFLLSIIWNSPVVLKFSLYPGAVLLGLLVLGLLYRYFSNPSIRWVLKAIAFLALMFVLMVVGFYWIQPNSDYLGNAGVALISAIIGGFVCKVFIPDN
jgi:hypothetical protein